MMATGKALGRDGRRWVEFSAGVGRSSAQCRAGKEGQLGTKSPAGAGLVRVLRITRRQI